MNLSKPNHRTPGIYLAIVTALVTWVAVLSGCNTSRPGALGDGTGTTPTPGGGACTPGLEGCPCDTPDAVADCGKIVEKYGDYVTCSMGTSTCTANVWGPCIGARYTQKALSGHSGSDLHILGSTGTCATGYDTCNPYCNTSVDYGPDASSPTGFKITPTGVTLSGSSTLACTSLVVTPSATSKVVTSFSSPGSLTFTVAVAPVGCMTSPYTTTWTTDSPDQATITGTNNTNGLLTLGHPLPGTIRVTAYAGGVSGYVDIGITIDVVDTTGTSPDVASTATQAGKFYTGGVTTAAPLPGSGNTTSWLYPYANTYLPLALPAPVIMYKYSATPSSTAPAGAIKVSLRYPATATELTATFSYVLIVTEPTPDPQIYISQTVWQAFEQTARGDDAAIVLQRFSGGGSGSLDAENSRTIHFVDGQLKGTVYYNSYNSPQGGNTGAVLSIAPGATTPTLAVQPSGKCTVCHSLNLDGSRLIANGAATSGEAFNVSKQWNMTSGSAPSPTVLQSYAYTPGSSGDHSTTGDKFTFGAPRTDGTLYMSHGGGTGGDANWRSPQTASQLWDPSNPGTAKTVTGWPNDIEGVTPRFSVDGSKLAFGFWAGTSLAKLPSGTLAADSTGKILTVVDFACTSGCTSGFAVSNARPVTTTASPGYKVAWPSFTPDGSSVIYQRQLVSSKAYISWSPSDINTVAGAQADLWISSIPATAATAPVPTRLNLLNGLNSLGTASYLPTSSRTVSAPTAYHTGGLTFGFKQADNCSVSGTAVNVNDYTLNYLPAVNPTEAGGKVWVVFTSRRMYGNIAYDNPWDAEPNTSCDSGTPPTKKLWVAAVEKTWTAGSEPSHPAFYLPGQELGAGNSNGYWVNTPCGSVGSSCTIDDDCCGGTASPQTSSCKITTAPSTKTCQNVGGACVGIGSVCNTAGSPGDCCTGLTCPGAGSTCVNPSTIVYTTQVYTKEYVGTCPAGTNVKWRFFNWRSSNPTGTSIAFTAQTKTLSTDTYAPTLSLGVGTSSASTTGTSFAHGASTVDQVLVASGLASKTYLLVTMTFTPSTGGAFAPTLIAWQQDYDCVPSE